MKKRTNTRAIGGVLVALAVAITPIAGCASSAAPDAEDSTVRAAGDYEDTYGNLRQQCRLDNWINCLSDVGSGAFLMTRVADLAIPGAHDAGAYNIKRHDVRYGSPCGGKLVQAAGDHLLDVVAPWANTQDKGLYSQASRGARYFDVRPSLALDLESRIQSPLQALEDAPVRHCHTAFGATWKEMFRGGSGDLGLHKFLDDHEGEFAIVDISKWYANANSSKVVNKMRDEIDNSCNFAVTQNDLDSIGKRSISELTVYDMFNIGASGGHQPNGRKLIFVANSKASGDGSGDWEEAFSKFRCSYDGHDRGRFVFNRDDLISGSDYMDGESNSTYAYVKKSGIDWAMLKASCAVKGPSDAVLDLFGQGRCESLGKDRKRKLQAQAVSTLKSDYAPDLRNFLVEGASAIQPGKLHASQYLTYMGNETSLDFIAYLDTLNLEAVNRGIRSPEQALPTIDAIAAASPVRRPSLVLYDFVTDAPETARQIICYNVASAAASINEGMRNSAFNTCVKGEKKITWD